MSKIKNNIFWNLLLTASLYLFPIVVFPYVTRILGADGYGTANFILSTVDYAIIFSSLGLATIGLRYVPQCGEDRNRRDRVFSSLVSIHIILSIIVLSIFIVLVFVVPRFYAVHKLFLITASKIIFNIFLVEWLFQGVQEFKYITIRTLFTRIIYVILVFALVKKPEDYDKFVYVTLTQVILNALINWRYSKKFVSYKFCLSGLKEYFVPIVSMGVNNILLSFYSTFNVMFLGLVCTTAVVGYFTTATKLYSMFIAVITSINGAVVPYLNKLLASNNIEGFKHKVSQTLSMVALFSIPITIYTFVLAPEVITLFAGNEYHDSILPFRIITLQIMFVAVSQITANQILLSFKHFHDVLICTISTTLISCAILVIGARQYGAVAGASAVAIPHVFEAVMLIIFARKCLDFKFPYIVFLRNCLVAIPIIAICLASRFMISNLFALIGVSFTISVIYYFSVEYFVVKDEFLVSQIKPIIQKVLNK